jgi:hypothetical protein
MMKDNVAVPIAPFDEASLNTASADRYLPLQQAAGEKIYTTRHGNGIAVILIRHNTRIDALRFMRAEA